VARYAGLTGSPDESGSRRREKGLAKTGLAEALGPLHHRVAATDGATLAACPVASVLALEGATSYWASVVANPPGHRSSRGASGTGISPVAPGEPARPIRLQQSPIRRPQGGTGIKRVARMVCWEPPAGYRPGRFRRWQSQLALFRWPARRRNAKCGRGAGQSRRPGRGRSVGA
jgi:hypothetical protein